MLTFASALLLLAANPADVPVMPKQNLEEIAGEGELQVFETDEIALDDSTVLEADPELVEIEE